VEAESSALRMVYYFAACDGTLMYMGKDKYENEDLIKYGEWPL
jgi:hypothetical protein